MFISIPTSQRQLGTVGTRRPMLLLRFTRLQIASCQSSMQSSSFFGHAPCPCRWTHTKYHPPCAPLWTTASNHGHDHGASERATLSNPRPRRKRGLSLSCPYGGISQPSLFASSLPSILPRRSAPSDRKHNFPKCPVGHKYTVKFHRQVSIFPTVADLTVLMQMLHRPFD